MSEQRIGRFARNSLAYGCGEMLYRGISFILLPIYLKYLSPADYGALETIVSTREICIVAFSAGIPSALLKFYYRTGQQGDSRNVIATSFWMYNAFQVGLGAILLIFSRNLSVSILNSPLYTTCFMIVALTIPFIGLRTIPLSLFRARGNALKYSVITFLVAVITLLLNLYFIVVLKKGIEGIFWANLIGSAFGVVFVLRDIKKDVSFTFLCDLARQMCVYGLPLAISMIPLNIILVNDRYFLAHFANLESVGIYALASKFSTLFLILFVMPFQLNWVPFVMENQHKESRQKVFAELGSIFFYYGLCIVFAISLVAPFAVKIMAPPVFYSAILAVPILSFSILLYGLGFIFRTGILVSENTVPVTKILLLSLALNLMGNYILIPRYSVLGAAIAQLATFAFMLIYSYTEGQKKLRIIYPLGRMLLIAVMAMLLIALVYMVLNRFESVASQIFISACAALLFAAMNYSMKTLRLRSVVRHLFQRTNDVA